MRLLSPGRLDRLERWVPRILPGISVVLSIACVATFVSTLRFVQRAESATGTVVDVDSELSDGDWVYYPVVRFTTADGRAVTFRSRSGSSSEPEIGDEVEVLYDPDDPEDAQLSDFFSLWLWPIATGGVAVASGLAFLYYPRVGPLARRRESAARRDALPRLTR